jgi:hypothetical protein
MMTAVTHAEEIKGSMEHRTVSRCPSRRIYREKRAGVQAQALLPPSTQQQASSSCPCTSQSCAPALALLTVCTRLVSVSPPGSLQPSKLTASISCTTSLLAGVS